MKNGSVLVYGLKKYLALSDDNGEQDLLTKFWLTFLDGGQDHVTWTGLWQTVQTSTDT